MKYIFFDWQYIEILSGTTILLRNWSYLILRTHIWYSAKVALIYNASEEFWEYLRNICEELIFLRPREAIKIFDASDTYKSDHIYETFVKNWYFWGQEKPLRFWCQWYNSDNIYETFVKNRFFEGKRSHRYFEGKRSHLIFWSQECYINILIFRGLKGNTDYSSNSWLYIFLSPRATHWDSKCHIQTKKAFVIGICIIILLGTNYIIKIEAKIVFPQLRVSLIKIQTYLHTYIIYNHNYIICK